MRRFLENEFAFTAVLLMFAVALTSNYIQGAPAPACRHMLVTQDAVSVAHGPTIPPDPWAGNLALAHGPTIPPDPWAGNLALAHGPTIPPDPWAGNLATAHGPTIPPDPWAGNPA